MDSSKTAGESCLFITMLAARTTPPFITLAFALSIIAATSYQLVSADLYTRCPDGRTYNGQIRATGRARSRLACAALCSVDSGCLAVNVLSNTTLAGWVTCVLLANQNPGSCAAGLTAEDGVYMFKGIAAAVSGPTTSTTNGTCENGGTYNASTLRCTCPLEFAGTMCERRIRDCADAVENGGRTDPSALVILLIQPINASTPFMVRCSLGQIGITGVLVRNRPFPSNINWTTARSWFGDELSLTPLTSQNYFVGLQNLHLLTSQATYSLSVGVGYHAPAGDVFVNFGYTSVSVGSESTSYGLRYDAFFNSPNSSADNGFSGTVPILFSTLDNDNDLCAETRGCAGWFGSSCSGYSPFADSMTWPVNGTDQSVMVFEMHLIKTSNYVVN